MSEYVNHWVYGGSLDIGNYPRNETLQFSLTDLDNEREYDRSPPPNWTKDSFDYRYNSCGFRSKEFDVDHSEPVLLALGCSFTCGIGLPIDDAWPEQLIKHIPGYTVYNAGLGGASTDTVARIGVNLIPNIKPDIVAILWPHYHRYETYNGGLEFQGPWSNRANDRIIKENAYNNYTRNKVIIELLQKIHKFKLLSIDVADVQDLEPLAPRARDKQHPGPIWHTMLADMFLTQYMQGSL